MIQLLTGMNIAGCAVIAMFFLRFYRQTRDQFFVLFAGAFVMLAFNWLGLGFTNPEHESRTYFYWLRLAAFVLFLGAIGHKNRGQKRR
jgi:hypothetical protein